MIAVGIDISKCKSMVAVAQPFGKIISKPFEVHHTSAVIQELITYLHTDGISILLRKIQEDITSLWLLSCKR